MSMADDEAKFPGQGNDGDIPPPATAENPGQVFPKSSSQSAPQSEHFDQPSTTGGQDDASPPDAEPTKSTGSVPGTGGPSGGGGGSFAAQDAVEDAQNPLVDQQASDGLQTD